MGETRFEGRHPGAGIDHALVVDEGFVGGDLPAVAVQGVESGGDFVERPLFVGIEQITAGRALREAVERGGSGGSEGAGGNPASACADGAVLRLVVEEVKHVVRAGRIADLPAEAGDDGVGVGEGALFGSEFFKAVACAGIRLGVGGERAFGVVGEDHDGTTGEDEADAHFGGETGEGGCPLDVGEPAFVFAPGGLGGGGEVEYDVGGSLAEERAGAGFVVHRDRAAIPGDGLDVLGLEVAGEGGAKAAGGTGEEGFGGHEGIWFFLPDALKFFAHHSSQNGF